uniref:Uncharacterized protein n=1 Tax=Rheinheimera sp. BAL341 TaxID=1708203 RepID=A0A486XT38_9GAMM
MMKRLAIITLLIATGSSAAVPVEQALELCRAEQNALKRLTCYDAIGNSAQATKSAAVVTTKSASSTTNTTPADNFGIEHKQNTDIAERLDVTVKSVTHSPRKELIIEFENGQRWRQVGSGDYKIAPGQQHYIKRGVLNSFFLANDNNNRTIRIRREQ